LNDLWTQLDVFLDKNKDRPIRIGTGELGDSLVVDHLTGNSKALISYFKNKPNVIFELKTKTVNIENILDSEPAPNIVISWSLNSSKMAESEEQGSPAPEERLHAAQRVVDKGFRVGFHFDPLILYPGCEKDYSDVAENLLEHIDPARMAWISLGSLRFPPPLKEIIQERFPKTKIIYSEMIKGKDGKLRYFKPLRLELYKNVVRAIKKRGGRQVPLYFCMEGKSIWREVLGWVPKGKERLEAYLSSSPGRSVV
jgi:spore photoproduct lyase